MSVSNIVLLDDGSAIGTLVPFRPVSSREICKPLNRDRLLEVREKINDLINRVHWHFETDASKLDLGTPFVKMGPMVFSLKPEWTVRETFEYWETHAIQIDCLVVLNITLLFYLREETADVESLRPCMEIDCSCGLVKTGFHCRLSSLAELKPPLCNIEKQREYAEILPAGCYCYVRGPVGWYSVVYGNDNRILQVETIYQGENVLSIGNSEFLAFSRDYNGVKFPHPQLTVKSFDYIVDELGRNGLKQLN